MTREEILSLCDHTLLKQDATEEQILATVEEAIRFGTASACIPPRFVRAATKYAAGRTKICTVIGFPNGYSTTAVKCAETAAAIADGADEIDMVIAIGALKAGRDGEVLEEIRRIKEACGEKLLKVIVETCLLTREEKIRACAIVQASGADFIKTSTGFGGGGATAEDIALFAANTHAPLQIKAAGGIADFSDAETFVRLGASRLGTSRLVALLRKEN